VNLMLRISTIEDEQTVAIRLEGRVAGPWVNELLGAWKTLSPRLAARKVQLDLRGVTFVDDTGKVVLREIYAQSRAEILAKTAWCEYLATEIRSNPTSDRA
jgi:anti-anti-sigma regulatory factor